MIPLFGGVPVSSPISNTQAKNGRFVKGRSGNPNGRPKGARGRDTALRRLEGDAMTLGVNVVSVFAQTMRLALSEVGRTELIPLLDSIREGAVDAIENGHIGPSPIASLRAGYDDLMRSDTGETFFAHVGLPTDCPWEQYKTHYTTRGRIDIARHAKDLLSYPPIASAIIGMT
jgi:hypothetical protein